MELYDIIEAIEEYEADACEDFWEEHYDICEEANKTNFFQWLKLNRVKEYDILLENLKNYEKEKCTGIFTITASTDIYPIEDNLLKGNLDILSIFLSLSLKMDFNTKDFYLKKYKNLESIIWNYKDNFERKFLSILFCEFLIETGDFLGKEIINAAHYYEDDEDFFN